MRLAIGKQLVFRRLVEDVVDHLDAVDQAGLQRGEDVGRFPAVDADADGPHQLLALQVVDRSLPAVIDGPRVTPHVELLQVDGLHAEKAEALLGECPDVIGWVGVFNPIFGFAGPFHVLGGNLGGGVELAVRKFADQMA